MPAQAESIKALLRELEAKANGVEASAVISTQGLPICSAMPPDVDESVIAAMSAAILGVGERAMQELSRGELTKILMEGQKGSIIMMGTGSGAILTTLINTKTNLGLIFMVMERTSARIAELLS
ncbi:MAG: roadblock/LC7 domain-containing protein [Candidatus Ranarchaeia archaeon]